MREFVGALPPTAVAQFLDELTGPSAVKTLVSDLQGAGELPEVVAALERGDHERALELLLAAIGAAEDGRRESLVSLTVGLFAELGHEHPLTVRYRRQLAARLF